jgi:hypothetical protein
VQDFETYKNKNMAKQRGVVKLEGTLDDITFLKTSDGYMAKVKSQVSASRINSDPNYVRTRENNAEFARAASAGKLLRAALRTEISKTSDSRMVSRLTREMMTVLHADITSPRGERNVVDGQIELLEGFEFNNNGQLGTSLYAPFTAAINRLNGECSVNLDPFIPANVVAAPEGSTHFRLFALAAEVDFVNQVFTVLSKESASLPLSNTATEAINLVNSIGSNSALPVFLALGIEFLQELNGAKYPLKNGAFNAMALVKVDK